MNPITFPKGWVQFSQGCDSVEDDRAAIKMLCNLFGYQYSPPDGKWDSPFWMCQAHPLDLPAAGGAISSSNVAPAPAAGGQSASSSSNVAPAPAAEQGAKAAPAAPAPASVSAPPPRPAAPAQSKPASPAAPAKETYISRPPGRGSEWGYSNRGVWHQTVVNVFQTNNGR